MATAQQDKPKVPALRFPEFVGDWEKKRLGGVVDFSKGRGVSKDDQSENAATPCLRYAELYTTYGDVIGEVFKSTNVSVGELALSQVGDILIPSSGETAEDIGIASCIDLDGVALGGDINILRGAPNGKFLAKQLRSAKRKSIMRLAQGQSIVHLYGRDLKTVEVDFPSLPEQQKIADFLVAVDERLEALRKRRDLLRAYKRGAMQKIFSQEIRFTRDDGTAFPDWETRKLSQLASKVKTKNEDTAHSRVLTNSAKRGVVDQRDFFDKDIANGENLSGYYVIELGDFVYNPRVSNAAPVGPIKRNDIGVGVMSPLYTVFRFDEDSTAYFLQYFGSTKWHRYLSSVGNVGARHDRMNIADTDFFAMPIPYPHPDEQKKIADFLLALDEKVAAVETQITETEAFKKGLLQQMFV